MNRGPSWLFGADWFKLLNACLIGFGNGALAVILMILGP